VGASEVVHGAVAVAERAVAPDGFSRFARSGWVHPAQVNGAAGAVVAPEGRVSAVIGFTVRQGRIVEIDMLADSARLRRFDLTVVNDEPTGRGS
jgi:hypothetical protein